MAAKVGAQTQKGDYLCRLILAHDFGMVYETHGTTGKSSAYSTPPDCTAFWCHFDAQRAGVGLLVHKDFLARFAAVRDTDWVQVEKGRLACLHLRGPEGNLDLWAAYLPTGDTPLNDKTARDHTRHLLKMKLAPTNTTLSVVAGDWNYVTHHKDRWCNTQKDWTGRKDTKEAEEADEGTFHPAGLHELYQENHTYISTIATSRIDRVYTNHHLSDQLDYKFGCTTLPREGRLSSHAAISFYRQKPPTHKHDNKNITPKLTHATINHPDWPKRVAAELSAISITPEDYNNPIRRLVLTKRAMHNVSDSMAHDHVFAEAATNDDKLNCTLSFIRAAQDTNLGKMYRKYLEYPHIATHINPRDPNACYTQGFRDLQDHAADLARQHLTDELQEAQQLIKENNSDFHTSIRKNNILTQLKKLQPGSCNSIGALETGNGEFNTDPKQIAERLAEHWGNTFRRTPINKQLLQQWLASLPQLKPQRHRNNQDASHTADSDVGGHALQQGCRTAPAEISTSLPTEAPIPVLHTASTAAASLQPSQPPSSAHQSAQLVARAMEAGLDLRGHVRTGPGRGEAALDRAPLPLHAPPAHRRRLDDEGNSAPGSRTSTRQSQSTTQSTPTPKPLGPLGRSSSKRQPLPTHAGAWRVRRKDVEGALRHSGNSAPGPDGIPFKAWRALGPLGVSILHATASCLEGVDAQRLLIEAYKDCTDDGTHQYNYNTMVCLPKKSTSTTQDGTEAYTTNNTRPLSIVNCDNRIVAAAARIRWEQHLNKWILPRQQGFLSNRSIIRNLLQLDTASMITSLTQPAGACILLDFASAFPSVSQEFLFDVLRHIGLPQTSLNLLTSLYSNSLCEVKQGNTSTPGFLFEAGVRQGCPLSPLLYATVAEVLLDKIEQQCPGTLTRCYADDTALVANDFWKEAPHLVKIFQEFSQISGLHLNLRKSFIIPLDEGELNAFQDRLAEQLPAWRDMQVARKGKYLGFFVGPEKEDKSWEEPTTKFLNRCDLWEKQGAGLQYQTTAYNTFALPTLLYIAQLEKPPDDTLLAETQGLRKVVKGPHQWAHAEDLWRLKEHYGQAKSCKSLTHTAVAAQLRVGQWDPACRHRDFRLDTEDLCTALSHYGNDVNRARWNSWYKRSFALTLKETEQHYTNKIGPIQDLINKKAQSDQRENTTPRSNPRQQFQKRAYDRLMKAEPYCPTARIRNKLARWELQDASKNPAPDNTTCRQNTPAWCARRSLASLQLLPKLVPPRVCAAALSTQWNRWCTHRRYQKRHLPTNRCLFGCGAQAEDSIEHYFRCPVTRDVIDKQLNLQSRLFANIHTATLCNVNINDLDRLTAIALLIYALYTTTNRLRHHPLAQDACAQDMVAQTMREGARHHKNATSVLDNRWNHCRSGAPLPPIPHTI